jgi:hypothetical protein
MTWHGDIVVAPGYISDIVKGAVDDGLMVQLQ